MTHTLAVVGARLNSSRLPRKHLLDLAGEPLIARLFARLEAAAAIDRVVLATTADAYNQPLVDWARDHGKQAFAFDGDVNDLTGRVDAVVRRERPEVLIYVCGDSPLVEPASLDKLVRALIAEPEADMAYIGPLHGRKPIHEGFDVYRAAYWRRLAAASVEPHEREHVGSARAKLAESTRTIAVSDDPVFYALDHRLSVDTPSDYAFMSDLYQRWQTVDPRKPVSLAWVVELLQREPWLRARNAQVRQKRNRDRAAAVLIAAAHGPEIGLGHLSRSITAARALQDRLSAGVHLLLLGPPLEAGGLALTPHRFSSEEPAVALARALDEVRPDALIVDMPQRLLDAPARAALAVVAENTPVVSIDFSLPSEIAYALNWVPSFFLDESRRADPRNRFGWDCFLLEPPLPGGRRSDGGALVLTGGGDALSLSQSWPASLDRALPQGAPICWVQGPFAPPPALPEQPRLAWRVTRSPASLAEEITRASCAAALYGVSLFECLAHGAPTVALTANRPPGDPEIEALRASGAVLAAPEIEAASAGLATLMVDSGRARAMSHRAGALMDGSGPARFAQTVAKLLPGPR